MGSIFLVMWKHFKIAGILAFLQACVSDYHSMTLSLAWLCFFKPFQLHDLVQSGLEPGFLKSRLKLTDSTAWNWYILVLGPEKYHLLALITVFQSITPGL